MKDLDHRLEQHLLGQARTLPNRPGSITAVIAHGRRRQHRQRAAVAASCAVLICGGAIGVRALAAPDARNTALSPAGVDATLVDSTLAWHEVTSSSSLGYSSATAHGSGNDLYALSTEPGRTGNVAPRQVVYHSADGIDWTAATAVANDLYLTDVQTSGSTLYAVGTASANAAIGSNVAVVATSTDGGNVWAHQQLPFDFAGLRAKLGPLAMRTSLAVGPHGSVAVTNVHVSGPFPASLLPAGVDPSAFTEVTSTGLTVYATTDPRQDPGQATPSTLDWASAPDAIKARDAKAVGAATHGAPIGTYTWAQLGVDADEIQALTGAPFTFTSSDGVHFVRQQLPADLVGPIALSSVHAVSGGFVIVNQSDTKQSASTWFSTDGVTWSSTSAPALDWVIAAGELDGQLVLVGQSTAGESKVSLTSDGQVWRDIDLGRLDAGSDPANITNPVAASVGPAGIALVTMSGTTSTLLHSHDGSTWSSTHLADWQGPATGYVRSVTVTDHVVVDIVTPGVNGALPTHRVFVGTPR
jgi:hypothetical protein